MALDFGHSSDNQFSAIRQARPVSSVCLITPPSAFLLDERVFISLGVLKVAASLEAHDYPVTHPDPPGGEK